MRVKGFGMRFEGQGLRDKELGYRGEGSGFRVLGSEVTMVSRIMIANDSRTSRRSWAEFRVEGSLNRPES